MGYRTKFYGRLEFTRTLGIYELFELNKVLVAGRYDDIAVMRAIDEKAEQEREQRGGKGPLIFGPRGDPELRAQHGNFVVSESLDPSNAGDLIITEDGRGLSYASEKSYAMVEAVNFIIANARLRIEDFGLRGGLFASTEFEPYIWLLKINRDGWAEQQPCRMTVLLRHDLKAYLRHLRWNWTTPSNW